MIQLRLALRECKKEWPKHIPMVLQMACILFLTIVSVSTVIYRFSYFLPFANYWNHDGFVFYADTVQMYEEDFYQEMTGVTDVALSYRYTGLKLNIENPLIYSDKLLERYTPPLKSGKLVLSDPADPLPNVLVNESSGYRVGDEIRFYQIQYEYTYDDEGNVTDSREKEPTESDYQSLRVSGVYGDNTKLLLMNGGAVDSELADYRTIYNDISSLQSGGCTILMSESEAKKYWNNQEHYAVFGIGMVMYEDGLDSSVKRANLEAFTSKNVSQNWTLNNRDLYKDSHTYCFQQVYTMMPFMIGILILFFLSMISVNSVSAVRKLRTYTIYRVCGMPWGKCLSIAAYKSLLITAAAGILCGLLMLLKERFNLFSNFLVSFGWMQGLFCLLFLLLNMGIAVLISAVVLRHAQINQLLHET